MTVHNDRPVRRTPEQQLAASQLMAQRAKSKIRNREAQKVSARHLVAGRLLVKAAAAGDAQAGEVLDRLAETLTMRADRALFGLYSQTANDIDDMIRAVGRKYVAATERGDEVAARAHMDCANELFLRWETETGQLAECRGANWVKVPGRRW